MSEPNTESAATSGRRFHLLRRLGAGAYGAVYLAEQESAGGFHRRVALKVLHPHHAASTEAGKRMRDEARILGRLQHRHIVTVLDLVELEDRWAVVMEVVPGADLEAVLQALEQVGEAFPIAGALEVGVAVCRALDFAYDCDDGKGNPLKVVHRDIKPSNIRLSPEGDVKVLDFGISSVQMETRESETGQFRVGTERYMAPERMLGDPDTPAGDVYAAALVVQELILGRPMGRTPIIPARHDKLVEETLVALDEKVGASPQWPELRVLLTRSLTALPEDRPAVGELGDALEALRKAAEGEDLRSFAGRFVPAVSKLLGREEEEAQGTLAERTMGLTASSTLMPPAPHHAAPTIGELPAPTGGVAAPGAALPTQPPSPTRGHAPSQSTLVPPLSEETWQERASSAQTVSVPPPTAHKRSTARWALGLLLLLPLVAAGAWGLTRPAEAPEPALKEAPVRSSVRAEPGVPQLDAPEPEPTPEPAPVETPEPPVKPTSQAAPSSPAPAPAPKEPPPPEAPAGPPVSAAMFVLSDASSLQVSCSGTSSTGTASVRLRDFPSGSCSVEAVYGGSTYVTRVTVEKRGEVRCSVSGDALNCEVR